MRRNLWNLLTGLMFGAIYSDIIMHASGFSVFLAQLVEAMAMRKYSVMVTLNEEEWGEYILFANSPQTACFLAGLKYQREEQQIYPGTKIDCKATLIRPEASNG